MLKDDLQYLLDSNHNIERKILSSPKEIPFSLFVDWRLSQERVGRELVRIALSKTAKNCEACIITNPVNPVSYAHFLRSDVQSKSFKIRERTLRSGVRSGFLSSLSDQFLVLPLRFHIQNRVFYGRSKENQEVIIAEDSAKGELLNVSCYPDGSFIISDIDLISIVFRSPSEKRFLISTVN